MREIISVNGLHEAVKCFLEAVLVSQAAIPEAVLWAILKKPVTELRELTKCIEAARDKTSGMAYYDGFHWSLRDPILVIWTCQAMPGFGESTRITLEPCGEQWTVTIEGPHEKTVKVRRNAAERQPNVKKFTIQNS